MPETDLLSLGIKLFFAYQKLQAKQQQRGQEVVGQTFQTVTDKDTALLELKQKAGSVSVLIGTRDTGKSVLSRRLAEFLGRPTYVVSPQQATPTGMIRIDLKDIMEKVPEYSTLVLDDVPAYLSNRSYHEELTQVIERAVPMVRHPRQPPEFPIGCVHLIFCTQSSSAADKYILDCDAAFFKPLGLLIEERPNVARIYKNYVNQEFEGKDTMWIKQHAFFMCPTYKGIISIGET